MPSSQTPSIAGVALDPPGVRQPIDDAEIVRVAPEELRAKLGELRAAGCSLLLDVGAVDYLGREPRFDLAYHLLALPTHAATVAEIGRPRRVRVLVGLADGETPTLPSIVDLWPNADWAEREIFDLYGIHFEGHPDLRRIQMPYEWEGHPLRKDYPLRGPAREATPRPAFALKSNVPAGAPPSGKVAAALQKQIARARGRRAGGRVVSLDIAPPGTGDTMPVPPLPSMDVVARSGNTMTLSMGPQHPSTHGVLQIVVEVAGEMVEKAEMEIGYLHTGIEKSAENLFWTQAGTVIERMDYLNPLGNAMCYMLAVERLLGITDDIPERAQSVRVLLCELSRIASHCVWLGTGGIDLGALSTFFYTFDVREDILDLIEVSGGARMHPNYFRIGGLNGDLPHGFLAKLDALITKFPQRMRELRALLQNNPILRDRMIDVGVVTSDDAVRWGLTGPALRGSGIAYDVRKAFPYGGYEKYAFDVPTRTEGDAYARFLVRLEEMDESMRIIAQVRKELDKPGPIMVANPKIAQPPKETIALSMEALIHHFKIVSESFRVPPGDVYQAIESPRGELAYYVVSNGNNRPYRVRTRPPSLYNLQALKAMAPGNLLADVVVMIGSLDPVFGEVDR